MPSVMIAMKKTFFSDAAIRAAVHRAQQDEAILRKAGAFVRVAARSSIRTVKRRSTKSRPGEPPRSHGGQGLNLRSIFYAWDTSSQKMIVGPVGFSAAAGGVMLPELHEEGGSRPTKINPLFGKQRKQRAAVRDPQTGRIRKRRKLTEAQRRKLTEMRRDGRLPPRPEDRPQIRSVQYPARPFMAPALQKELPKFPGLWENSVR